MLAGCQWLRPGVRVDPATEGKFKRIGDGYLTDFQGCVPFQFQPEGCCWIVLPIDTNPAETRKAGIGQAIF